MLLCRVVKINVNNSEIAAECLKMFGVDDVAEVVAIEAALLLSLIHI